MEKMNGVYELICEVLKRETDCGNLSEDDFAELVSFASMCIAEYSYKTMSYKAEAVAIKPIVSEKLYVNALEIKGQTQKVFMSKVPFNQINISKRAIAEELTGEYFPDCDIRITSVEVSEMLTVNKEDYE